MSALGRSSRAVLAGAAFVSFASAFVTAPIVARGAGGVPSEAAPPFGPPAKPTPFTAVPPRRDPFAGDPVVSRSGFASSSPAAPIAASPAMPPLPPIPAGAGLPAAVGPLPPNDGASNTPFPADSTPPGGETARVTAVVTGAHPYALVDDGTMHLVTLGDRVAGDTVFAITSDGVRLQHGRLLHVSTATPPTATRPTEAPAPALRFPAPSVPTSLLTAPAILPTPAPSALGESHR